ncbi:MAG: TraR/DksA C4-type zinc finger protein [Zhongshania sp.]|uniref:TraR/DksA C4-type zinc finger protein n=1 Tax=Zhongshania sp. TaxID=1971902 RepID=UPI002625E26F|nr:TraR/DksA C4-type zinc finger protein [Zhongshania sp.]MDF1691757.1 TraR/DksA C4-type zinc finger protein [Zhongshania sp.]
MNESDFERAAQFADRERENALAKHRQKMASQIEGGDTCEDCGGPIPPERQAAVKTVFCVECQQINERLR